MTVDDWTIKMTIVRVMGCHTGNPEKGVGEMNTESAIHNNFGGNDFRAGENRSVNTESFDKLSVAQGGTNGFAVTALVTGILSLLFFWGGWLFVATAGVGIATGIKGARVAATGKGQRGLATAGLVLGILAAVLEFVMLCSIGRP